jgi:hypothetical protein
MEQIPSETESRSACQEISALYRPRRLIKLPKSPPLGLILAHIYFRLKCNLLPSHPSSSVYVSAVYGHHLAKTVALCQNYDRV